MWYGPGDLVPKRRRTGVTTFNDSLRAAPSVALAPAMPATDSSIGVGKAMFVVWAASAVQSPDAVPGSLTDTGPKNYAR